MRILIFGASGMLGNALFRVLSKKEGLEVFGTVRSEESKNFFPMQQSSRLISGCDVTNDALLEKIFLQIQPDVVINSVSLSKELLAEKDPLKFIPIYSLLPHRLAKLCLARKARLIQISSDGVFSGAKGGYSEEDPVDTQDLYGISKYLGEVHSSHAITLRTSIIGHELQRSQGLISWFLGQEGRCKCYSHAIFSGFPTVVLAQIICDHVIPRPDLSGLYHVAANPISKCDLLKLVAEIYGKSIEIVPDERVVIDRSLRADRFRNATGYEPPDWRQLIQQMHLDHTQAG